MDKQNRLFIRFSKHTDNPVCFQFQISELSMWLVLANQSSEKTLQIPSGPSIAVSKDICKV